MDKHEFAEIIIEGLKKRKADKILKNKVADSNFYGYARDRSSKTQKEHNRLK